MDIRKLVVNFRDIFFYKILELNLSDCSSVLDVGCGSNSPIKAIKKMPYSEGIDIYRQGIIDSKKNKIHDKYTIGNIQSLEKYYKNKSVDAVIAVDVIEHFEKKDALELLKELVKKGRKNLSFLLQLGCETSVL